MNNIVKKSILFLLLQAFYVYNVQSQDDLAKYVDPMIGSDGHGHVFVGANVPFGAVQLGPQNINKGWDWTSGYHYSDSIVIAFSHTHLSGTGCADLGDIGFMPYMGKETPLIGTQKKIDGTTSSYYRHDKERAEAGYYLVNLENGVDVELTATERVGYHRYHFNGIETPHILIDLVNANSGTVYESGITLIDDTTIQGYRFSNGWATPHKIYFYAKLSVPMSSFNIYNNDYLSDSKSLESERVKGVATFGNDVRDVKVKVALSSVSCENAKMNMDSEGSTWDFDVVRKSARDKWNKMLSKIEIEGTDRQKTIFYTALYHSFIAPILYSDVNGDFRGMDDKIHTNNGFTNYTIFSLWDTYRTLHPMYTIILPERLPDMINSMLSIYDQNGKLPIWPLYMDETNCMPGYSSVPVIADAYLKGIKGFDPERALRYMVSTATNPKQKGVSDFMKYGFIPADCIGEATSINLEYAADDWGLALMAKEMGHEDIYDQFIQRGKSYEKLFDKRIMKVHPKMKDGSWFEPYSPFRVDHKNNLGDFTEGNGWQYTFMVPQNPDGLIRLHGSDDAFIKNLDELFVADGWLGEEVPPDVSGFIGQYAHGNEPVHHIPYLYAYAGVQWKTAELVRMLQEKFYTDDPVGYCGNEDCGQMSAWHIMSALGLFQVNPSNGDYIIGSPLFTKATINLTDGKRFTIVGLNNDDKNIYVESAKLNGNTQERAYLTYQEIMKGGTLELTMSSKPNKEFGTSQENRPHSAR